MAVVGENWQTMRPTIKERIMFLFNKELLSDVKFVVPVSNGESESKVIPAHKFTLAISSPVFFAMFYGQMAETTDRAPLNCLTVTMRVCWNCFVICTATNCT